MNGWSCHLDSLMLLLHFFENILIYNSLWPLHLHHLEEVLKVLQAHFLHAFQNVPLGYNKLIIWVTLFPGMGWQWIQQRSRQFWIGQSQLI